MKNIFKNAGADFVYVESSKYKNNETQAFVDFNGFYEDVNLTLERIGI